MKTTVGHCGVLQLDALQPIGTPIANRDAVQHSCTASQLASLSSVRPSRMYCG